MLTAVANAGCPSSATTGNGTYAPCRDRPRHLLLVRLDPHAERPKNPRSTRTRSASISSSGRLRWRRRWSGSAYDLS